MFYCNEAEVSVVAPFYGDVPANSSDLKNICSVVGSYGEQDAICAPQGHRLKFQRESLSVEHDLVFYPDAGHSCMNRLKGLAKLGPWTPMRAHTMNQQQRIAGAVCLSFSINTFY
ncbi:MAG: dienelactone hydrolase family protein [Pseudomonadales bacterium]|nr:dienelactone hydrolase family protein [Pseudomonadales bacterium]